MSNRLSKMSSEELLNKLGDSDELDAAYKAASALYDMCKNDEIVHVTLDDSNDISIWVNARDLRSALGRRVKKVIAEIIACVVFLAVAYWGVCK